MPRGGGPHADAFERVVEWRLAPMPAHLAPSKEVNSRLEASCAGVCAPRNICACDLRGVGTSFRIAPCCGLWCQRFLHCAVAPFGGGGCEGAIERPSYSRVITRRGDSGRGFVSARSGNVHASTARFCGSSADRTRKSAMASARTCKALSVLSSDLPADFATRDTLFQKLRGSG